MLARKSGNIVLMISGGLFVLTGAGIALNQYVSGTAQKRLRNVAHLDRNFYAGEMAAVQQFIYARQNPTATDTATGGEALAMTLSQFNGNASTNPNTQNVDRSVTSSRDTAPGFFVQGYTGSNLKARRKGMGTAARVFCGQLEAGSSGAMGQVCLGEIVVPTGAYKVTPCYHWGEEDPDFIANAIDINNEADFRSRFGSASPPAAYYRLTADITFTSPLTEMNLNNSILDGGGHTIYGLETAQNYGAAWTYSRGLFSSVTYSKIKNLSLRDVRVVANTIAPVGSYQTRGGFGAVAGVAHGSCFDGISVIGGIVGGKDFTYPEVVSSAGGLIGEVIGTAPYVEISNSFTALRVSSRMVAGGLVGRATQLTVGGSSSLSHVKAGQVAAGLVNVTNSNFSATVTQSAFGGTLEDSGMDNTFPSYMPPPSPRVVSVAVGWGKLDQVESRPRVILHSGYYIGLEGGKILHSLEAGEVTRYGDERGWKVGYPLSTTLCWIAYPEQFVVTQSLSTMSAPNTPSQTSSGTDIKTHYCGSVTDTYWDTDRDTIPTGRDGVGKTTAELKSASLYSSWDSTKWRIENGQYPKPKKVPPLPAVRASCTLQATPLTVNAGESVELRITALGNATYALINEEKVAVSDPRLTVTPQFTRTYEAWAMGPDGVAPCRVEVTVTNRPRFILAGVNTHDPTVTSGTVVANRYIFARYHHDGSLDSYFGANGWIASMFENYGAASRGREGQLVMLSGGKFLAMSPAATSSGTGIMISRFQRDGALDPTFGTLGKKLVPLSFIAHEQPQFTKAAVQADGKILLLGSVLKSTTTYNGSGYKDPYLLRLNADGTPDGTHSLTATPLGSVSPYPTIAYPMDLKILSDGSALVLLRAHDGSSTMAGCPASPSNPEIAAVIKVTPGGTLDPGFGSSGISRFCLSGLGYSYPRELLVVSGGKILVTGSSFSYGGSGPTHALSLTRLNANGTLDTSYAGTGWKLLNQTPWESPSERFRAHFLPGDSGKYLLLGAVAATSTNPHCFHEIDADGVWNESFGTSGKKCHNMVLGSNALLPASLPESLPVPNGPSLLLSGVLSMTPTVYPLERDGDLDTAFGQTLLDPFFPYNGAWPQSVMEQGMNSSGSPQGTVRQLWMHAKQPYLTSFFPSIIGAGFQN